MSSFQQGAPGREQSQSAPKQPAATEGQPSEGTPDASATPPAGGCPGGSMGTMLIFLLPLALIWFMTRNQNKKQKDLESGLKVGDRVITRAGLIGKISKMGERTLELELAPGVYVHFLKGAIEGLDTGDPKKDEPKKDAAKDKDAPKDDPKKDPPKDKDAPKDKDDGDAKLAKK